MAGGGGSDLLNLFYTLMFDESLRMAEGLFRKREMASEGMGREDTAVSEGGSRERPSHREERKMSAKMS